MKNVMSIITEAHKFRAPFAATSLATGVMELRTKQPDD
jgi:hypothetical protein